LNSSPLICGELPCPGEAKVTLPGFVLAKARRSPTECTCDELGTTKMLGKRQISVTGAKSASGS
jgi:hypothetical protein